MTTNVGTTSFPRVETIDFSLFGDVEVRPMNKIRRVIARRMTASWVNVPTVVQFDECDLGRLDALRARLEPQAAARGVKLTILPFVIAVCSRALAAIPEMNASLDETGDNLILKKYCNIGFAVDTPLGLIAPVIRGADRKGVLALADEIASLAERARSGRLAFSDAEGGCFSVTNLGRLGGTGFTPTINAPEVGVLGIGRAARRLVEIDGSFLPRPMLPVTLAYDHRVIDGAVGGRFMEIVRKGIEAPEDFAI
ncbi:MAG: hypothetical protein GX458_03170 [Phyllobacteriaceae bacterium]|nr:hypothetical protein [Phyllobacteriaceae bacterium]